MKTRKATAPPLPTPCYREGLHCLTPLQARYLTLAEELVEAAEAAKEALLQVPPAEFTNEQARALILLRDALSLLWVAP